MQHSGGGRYIFGCRDFAVKYGAMTTSQQFENVGRHSVLAETGLYSVLLIVGEAPRKLAARPPPAAAGNHLMSSLACVILPYPASINSTPEVLHTASGP